MSVSPTGRIDAVWNDTRGSADSTESALYCAFSYDGGATWTANEQASPVWNCKLGYPNQNKIGDYYHTISDDAGAAIAYAATFNNEQDVYFLRTDLRDCNENGVPDPQDIASGFSNDCDNDVQPDDCEPDCNNNDVNDQCDLASGTSLDCNGTGVPDDCEPGHEDCNNNGTLDQCEVFVDCNANGHLDSCDLASGAETDCNLNGLPDSCELPSTAQAADNCAAAHFVTPGVLYNDTTTATTNTDAGSGVNCGSPTPTGRDVYYRYRPFESGLLTVSLCGNTVFDSVLSIHTGCPATAANQVPGACDDDTCGGGGASAVFDVPVVAGATYLIRVAGFGSGASAAFGAFGLTLEGPDGVGDCDNNTVLDECQIAAGGDANGNGLPDICEAFPPCGTCAGDVDGENHVDGRDIRRFVNCLLGSPPTGAGCGCADMNNDNQLNNADVQPFIDKVLIGGCP
jgi:hypothetical protein